MNRFFQATMYLLVLCLLSACAAPTATSLPVTITAPAPAIGGLSENEIQTLASLQQVDEYPLYTMKYYGEYESSRRVSNLPVEEKSGPTPAWACSLFTVLLDEEHLLYGRNFDWQFSPALLLYTDPPDGYASVSMVDIEYLGFSGQKAADLTGLPLEKRRDLLDAPRIPFDGMNEQGLAIGMAAVPPGDMRADSSKETIGSLGIMREILDHAGTVGEAVDIMKKYNIDFTGGPPVHYLIADATGQAVLVEFYTGEMHVIENDQPWHAATNFLRSSVENPADGNCWRYDRINARLDETQGSLDQQSAMQLLSEVAQNNTQWSVVYQMARGTVSVAMGRNYEKVQTFPVPSEWAVNR